MEHSGKTNDRTRQLMVWALVLTGLIFLASCGTNEKSEPGDKAGQVETADQRAENVQAAQEPRPPLPEGIQWLTNDTDPEYASPEALKGGTFHQSILSFPPTFRVVGPDSNSSLRSLILDNQWSLISLHPNTENIIPMLATHWAFGKDKKTMYFKLNPKARWSDGQPVTADDFAYTLEFMRSKHIVAPWYNDYYSREIEKVIVYDDHTLAVVSPNAKPDLYLYLGISPTPRHFFGQLDENFVQKYNWAIVPNTGPYQISDFKKGKHITFKRKNDWWAKDLRYYRHRFNPDKVIYTVIRDLNISWAHFLKGELDSFGVNLPDYWHIKSQNTPEVQNGYIKRIWLFTDTRQPSYGLYLNQSNPILKDRLARYAFAHAINIRKVIEKVLYNDYYRLENGYVGYGRYSNTEIKARRFDLNKVNADMQEAGWTRGPDGIWQKDGLRFSVEVNYSSPEHTPRLVVLKEEALKAGIELRLALLDPTANYKKVMEKKHDVAWMGWSTSLRPRFWEHYHSVNANKPQTNNITNTADPELDKMIDAYRASLDAEERIRLSHEIQEKIHEIGAYVPTYMVPYTREACWRWWRLPDVPGTKTSGSLFDPFNAEAGGMFWLDPGLKAETEAAMEEGRGFGPELIIDETYKMASIRDEK